MAESCKGRVTKAYERSAADPIAVRAGEEVTLNGREYNWDGWTWLWCTSKAGKSGWVPEAYLELNALRASVRVDYKAIELTLTEGEGLQVEKEESGWCWCVKQSGESGWVPSRNIVRI
ncbi:hypothetical protein EPA93_28550 [Ktedonosporobacter rubrisoli]|uniref:SH3 domain-containing protein n=1 Tax=Ktedonosporobacter rubrisoli TaxID=2509675 RepID=A0A4P6JVZ3_KTERU|nr:SH3 domain-containing protein [Ktedonosporobacter rubrisoli]QBD79714.1 hypothetical protein EPA93_28550 [Ktedonosporobacter rubrisoli]